MTDGNLGILRAVEMGYKISKSGEILNPNGIVIKGTMSSKGYKVFRIRRLGLSSYTISVHRLQAYQKFGDVIFKDKKLFVIHKNRKFLDNSEDNIILGTQSQSRMLIPEETRMKLALNATSKVRKYDKVAVKAYHEANGKSYKKTMAHFEISSKGTLNFILK